MRGRTGPPYMPAILNPEIRGIIRSGHENAVTFSPRDIPMSGQREFETPSTVNVAELNKTLEGLKSQIKALSDAKVDQQIPGALSEQMGGTEEPYNYKPDLIKLLQTGGEQWRWTGPESFPFFEAIGAASAGSAVPEIWAKDVFRCCPYPASAFWGAPYIKWHEDIKGKPGDTVHVVTVGRATCGTAGCAEPASTAPTIGATAITLEEYQCSMYVCRDDLEDMIEDTITELNNALAECIDICIDNAFIANIIGLGSTLDKGTAYITAADIAEAIGTMRSGTCEPVVFIIHPAVESRLMRDSQFVNAATYGDRSVITGGHIIQYLGLDVVVVPKGSLVIDAPGTYASLMLSRYAVHAAMKRVPSMETQYLVQTQRKYLYASVRFGKSVVCNDGVLWVRTGA